MQQRSPSNDLRKGRAAKRDFKDRLERACQRHGTTLEKARVPVRGCRKVTYVLDWGRVTGMHNFQNEKGAVKLVPNGFKVVFEASNYVWIAEVQFSTPGMQATDVPMFQVYPVRPDGNLQHPGSGWLDNISAAFRRALGMLNGDLQKEQHRPNGRLYLGIFYPAVQNALMEILRDEPHRVDTNMRGSVREWLGGGNAASIAAASPRNSGPGQTINPLSAKPLAAPPAAMRAPSSDSNTNNVVIPGSAQNHATHSPPGPAQSQFNRVASQVNQNGSISGRPGLGAPPPASNNSNANSTSNSAKTIGGTSAAHTNSGHLWPNDPIVDALTSGSAVRPHSGLSSLKSSGIKAEPPSGMPNKAAMHPSSSSSSLSSSAASASVSSLSSASATGSMPPPKLMGNRNRALGVPGAGMEAQKAEENRKRAMADGGHKLLHIANSGNMNSTGGLQSIEDVLQSVLSQLKSSNITEEEHAAASIMQGMEDVDPQTTRRVLSMLKEIKRELMVRSASKRRRTSTDDGSEVSAASSGPLQKRIYTTSAHETNLGGHHHANQYDTSSTSSNNTNTTPYHTSTNNFYAGSHGNTHRTQGQHNVGSLHAHSGNEASTHPNSIGPGVSNIDRGTNLGGLPGKTSHPQQQTSHSHLFGSTLRNQNSTQIPLNSHPLRSGLPPDSNASHHASANGIQNHHQALHSTGPDAGAGGFGLNGVFGLGKHLGKSAVPSSAASNAAASDSDHFQAFDSYSIGSFSDSGIAMGNLFDLEDFDTNETGGKMPIIVGCHLSHEGLFLRLAPPNTDGFSEEELANAMTSLRIPAASSIVRATLQAADVNNNGRVSMPEFLNFLKRREEELKQMFDSIDRDRDGVISLRDLKWARDEGKLEQTASDEELQALLEWMDTLEDAYMDGKIHFEEFRTGLILLPPATTLTDLIRHFREQGTPEARYGGSPYYQ